jgi:hypothetical protein
MFYNYEADDESGVLGGDVHRVSMGGAAVGMFLLGVALDRLPRI